MPKLRWKREPYQTGLARIGSGPRGSFYWDGETVYARTSAIGGSWRGPLEGWYWYGGNVIGVPGKNTSSEPVKTEAEAKKQASEYIKNHLRKAK